jgi:hypothetical protein
VGQPTLLFTVHWKWNVTSTSKKTAIPNTMIDACANAQEAQLRGSTWQVVAEYQYMFSGSLECLGT